jgi:glycosyltransferase involved in cell wall biosynthesis
VFTGRIPADRFAGYLQLFDVLVIPSLFSEGCPRVMIEAMAQGRAVIGARSGAIPEVLEDGVNGKLVTPGSTDELVAAIGELLDSPGLRAQLGARARETARTLTPERERREWLDVHAALLDGAPLGVRG